MWVVIICVYSRIDFVILFSARACTMSINMKFKFKWYIDKSAFFPLPPLLLWLLDYVDCWNIMAINSIIIIIILDSEQAFRYVVMVLVHCCCM